MADKTEFLQAIDDAILDADSLEKFINGSDSETVLTRLSAEYPTLKKAIKQMFENGGLPATPFATKALMTASALVDGDYAIVTDDTVNNGLYVKTAGAWVKSGYDPFTRQKLGDTNLNDVKTSGRYAQIKWSSATLERNYPVASQPCIMFVENEGAGGRVRQYVWNNLSLSNRFYTPSTDTWSEWAGVKFNGEDGLVDVSDVVHRGGVVANVVTDLGAHLDDFTTEGEYYIRQSAYATLEKGFPFDREVGWLRVIRGAALAQHWESRGGIAMRYALNAGDGSLSWLPWRGIKYATDGITNLGSLDGGLTRKRIIGWGSSTLGLASSYFTTMAERHNHDYIDHGVSGETLAVSGMQQGSNIVTLKFADAVLTNNTNHAVTITQSFKPKRGRAYKAVELSNGVKGLLYFSENNGELANTFKPTNLTEPLAVDTTYEYRAITPDFINQGKGLYYFDIGKNNMGYDDTAQDIVDAQQEMIDYIPEGSEYLVGGHFINTGLGGTDYGNKVAAVNQMLKLRYGLRFCDYYDFLYDDAIWDKYGITKTSRDTEAIAAGELPPSLGRDVGTGTRDTAHLRDEMSAEIALQAEARFIELGYIE